MRLIIAAVILLVLAVASVAPAFGYPAFATAAWVGVFAILTAAPAVVLVERFTWTGSVDAIVRFAVIVLAIVAGVGLVLGASGAITRIAYVATLAGVLAVSIFVTRSGGPKRTALRLIGGPERTALPLALAFGVALTSALLIFVIAYGLTHSPLTAYDSLSYHLYFPGRWLQDHRLTLIPTPFSDEAQAYAPANGELYFLWLMLPVHGDLLARVGQVPFYFLIGATLFALARRIGARPAHAMYAALFCFVSRPMVEQAVGADVDLICWSLFLAALHLGLIAAERNERRDWLVWGVAVGLYAGTKYVALVYLPVVLLLPLFFGGLRSKMAWALPGIAAFAAPWYLRNWILAGSPLYPASLAVAGVTLARGAFTRAAMLHSVFHTTDVRLFPVMAAHAFGPALIVCWMPLAAIGAWRLVTRQRTRLGIWLFLTPGIMALLYWFGVPDNVDSRFLLPAAMLAQLPLAFAFGASRRWNAVIHALCSAALIWILVGTNTEIHADLPWFMGGWLNLWGLITAKYLVVLSAFAIAAALMWQVSSRLYVRAVFVAAGILLASAILARGANIWCAPYRCEYLQTTSIFLRSSFIDAWHWTDAHISGATIAYTANNVPYPLMGGRLTNRVLYVNIDRHATWRLHEYARAFVQRRAPVGGPTFATSSGVLGSAASSGGVVDAVRPRFERMSGDPQSWTTNLRTEGVGYLFVSALSAYEIDYNWHNEGGFPIEDAWARADPQAFKLVYENAQVRIYSFGVPNGVK